ncbi:contactin-associated protein like 5-3 [Lingula anatina]|uniref:Contactin-associated protein like 5-3 n=1 Tax=Lingula anatina TaxID=7574 RepID=A0A1S3JXY1_LINAN|nr:contactin-associated protein like 5-3 [Lingula anatina]|eukprot:XP_013415270.1 contactin-associated protein like 5-3 [Lingula anatina]
MTCLQIAFAIFCLLSIQDVGCKGVPRSCEDVLSHYAGTVFREGVYTIDPDGPGGVDSFQVICTTRDDLPGRGVTLLPPEDGTNQQHYKGPGNYTRYASFKYRLTEEQLESLTRISGKCRQFVRFQSHLAFNFHSSPWWVSRQGWGMTNWGGAPTNSSKCACAMQNSCDYQWGNCNSYMTTSSWVVDEGYLDDKRYLPVMQVPIRDLDEDGEEVYLLVKSLECYGGVGAATEKTSERCQCSLHAEDRGTTPGPLLLQLPDLLYGQRQNDLSLDDGNKIVRVTDVYPQFFQTKKRRQMNKASPSTTDVCVSVLQQCPTDCERLARLALGSNGSTLGDLVSSGGMKKPRGQVMCENAEKTFPPPGRRILAFFKTAPECRSVTSSTYVFPHPWTLCCNVYSFAYNQVVKLYNPKCVRDSSFGLSALFG